MSIIKELDKNLIKIQNNIDSNLSIYATKNSEAYRIDKNIIEKSDIRLDFARDIDRILHSITYNKLADKTQVYHEFDNSSVSKRGIHVQLVSKIARTISRYLNLNEDLTEAIALSHDVGHTPFGHQGEYFLNDLMLEFNNTYFNHNVHSIRVLMYIENNGLGLNLTMQTLDGVMCHNGEFECNNLKPVKKTIKDLMYDYEMSYVKKDYVENLMASTLEGCVVRISDMIAYLGRDIEDAILLNNFNRNTIPPEITNLLGNNNSSIINSIVLDIVNNSYGKDSINMSNDVFACIKSLKKFNYKHIYNFSMKESEKAQLKSEFRNIFISCIQAIEENNKDHIIYIMFLNNMADNYLSKFNNYEKTCDFIAGLTDTDFKKVYKLINE